MECSSTATYMLCCHVHSHRDFLAFCLEVARELVGGLFFRQRIGHPRSDDHERLDRLNLAYRSVGTEDGDEQVRSLRYAVARRLGSSNRHETNFECWPRKVAMSPWTKTTSSNTTPWRTIPVRPCFISGCFVYNFRRCG